MNPIFKGIGFLFTLLFGLGAAVQYNDPDSLAWIIIYLVAAIISLFFALNKLNIFIPLICGVACFIGFVYTLSTRPFRVGDWIQVGNHYGEVSSLDWAKIAMLEINKYDYHYTGKSLYLPNSQLITTPVKNLNFLKRYAVHHFTVTRDNSVNPYEFIQQLKENASAYCADFIEVATRYNQLIENRLEIHIAGPEPHIQIATSELGDTQIIFTVFCPTDKAMEIEQKLTSDVFSLWFAHKVK